MIRALILLLVLMLGPKASATTIAYDGQNIAADTQMTAGSIRMKTHKIHRVGDAFVAFAGDVHLGEKFLSWYKAGADPKHYPIANDETNFEALVITNTGCLDYDTSERPTVIIPPFAIGSGGKCATAVMLAGKSAKEAVEITGLVDVYTSGPVDCHSVLELTP